jgi:two-component system sensor histidine kinase BaeS
VLTVYLDGLQDGVVDWNNAPHTIMAGQLTRLTRLMEDIDDVSRAQERRIDLDLAEEGLGDLLHTAAATAGEAYADKGVDLQVETITDTARVLVDRQRFGQVMSNLLSNALRHTPAGGQVRISVHREGASTARIHVADDGEGIPSGQLEHIFERFYRGDAARSRDNGGAGIGLTISKALIEAHGGTLTATSPGPGRGAVFALRLPLSSPESEEVAR